jgi:hypothetical protein
MEQVHSALPSLFQETAEVIPALQAGGDIGEQSGEVHHRCIIATIFAGISAETRPKRCKIQEEFGVTICL